ncbi:WD repeat-containing protein on Y chromosome-like [Diorhabda carinulata]|uniref:WD repeat-containing protein on Y chromosome-like n=1 Tax=Diorhabda carinulata TaxID=1163345 RepID=UPI0025A252C2|nr:WD repeat-containing protein on Y chromosome-like [Diorhabda carinulata]
MAISTISDKLHSLSFDSLEETTQNTNWYPLVKLLTYEQLESLKTIFKNTIKDNEEIGLEKEAFSDAIIDITGNSEHCLEARALFEEIAQFKQLITWNNLLDFLLENITIKSNFPVYLYVESVESYPTQVGKQEAIAKIVLIETEKYFCYAVVSKYGRVTIYDGDLNFLTHYHVLMTREDLEKSDEERRRKNRWVTDAIFCLDIQMFFIANSTRSISIYEASGLKHVPYWLIIGVHDIIECFTYKGLHQTKADEKSRSKLFAGTSKGHVIVFKFLQPETTILRRKHSDKLTIFYWDELKYENQYLKIQFLDQTHACNIEQIEYSEKEDAIISCSKNPAVALVKQCISIKKSPYILKMKKGCTCFTFSNVHNIIITGSNDRIIRVWNSVLISHTIAVFYGHQEKIVDLVIMENQDTLLSLSEDGILKLWEINESKCLQTLSINYPSLGFLEKCIEFGRRSMYPGSKRHTNYSLVKDDDNSYKKFFGISQVEKRPAQGVGMKSKTLNKWERSNLLVTCYNYIARIKITFENIDIEKSNEMPILSPPPLQNSVLIPASWEISMKEGFNGNEILNGKYKGVPEKLNFIINKDLFDIEGSKSDINYKIAILEAKKMKMKSHVENGAPYLALDIAEFEELKLSDNIKLPENKEALQTINNIKKRLEDICMRDRAFSEPSSGRSKISSRSSVISIT